MFQKIIAFWRNFFKINPRAVYFLIFLIAFLFFFWLNFSPSFADPDSFYHTKMAELISERGVIRDFPWTQFTVLKEYYIDHHFLYHLSLIPFIKILPPLVGVKISAVFFISLAVILFYWLLKKFQIKYAGFFLFILMVNGPFIFRMSLAKTPAPSLIILLLALFFLFQRRHLPLFFLSFLYVWLHASWPLLLLLVSSYILVSNFSNSKRRGKIINFIPFRTGEEKLSIVNDFRKKSLKFKNYSFRFIAFNRGLFSQTNLKLFFSCLIGLLAGLIINPYFPKNFTFYWYQIVKIAVINFQDKIGVGGEWYPYEFFEFLGSSGLVFILLVIVLTLFVLNYKKQSENSWTLFILSLFFFILTLKSRRHVEYFIPFVLLFSAFSLTDSLRDLKVKKFFREIWQAYSKKKIVFVSLIIYFSLALPVLAIRDTWETRKVITQDSFSFIKFQAASEWLRENSQPGEIIFQDDWDNFPLLFYHNSQNYYLVGLDPTFMYEYDSELYEAWKDITLGEYRQDFYKIIKEQFGAIYVLVDKDHRALAENLANNFYFVKVYEDEEVWIYQVE